MERLVLRVLRTACLLLLALALLGPSASGQSSRVKTLLIGTSGTLSPAATESKEKAAIVSLKKLIKDTTGLKNDIIRQANWRELAQQMADGELQVGVFQGIEFAWAKEKFTGLKPLTLAVNARRDLIAYVVVRGDSKAKDFAELQGQEIALPKPVPAFARLYLERECQTRDKKVEDYFAKVSSPESIEDTLDAIVDGELSAAVVDRAGLDSFKRRKPGRARELKQIAQSKPVPSAVIAYQEKSLDRSTLSKFKSGLQRAGKSARGQTLLTLFRLTGFEAIPKNFEAMLTETRAAYPPQDEK